MSFNTFTALFIPSWWTPMMASVVGLLLGVFAALVVTSLRLPRRPCVDVEKLKNTASGRVSRQARATRMLEEFARSFPEAATPAPRQSKQTGFPSDTVADATSAADGEESEEWETDEEAAAGSDEEAISDSEISEYERMESLRLKMVFVVRQSAPKMPANMAAELTASAGVGLVEWINNLSTSSAAGEGTSSCPRVSSERVGHECLVSPSMDEIHQWRTWYAWWDRIGCAKIALKCSEVDVMESVVTAAALNRLPIYVMQSTTAPSRSSPRPTTEGKKEALKSSLLEVSETLTSASNNTIAVIALGPAPADVLDPITGKLKLFS